MKIVVGDDKSLSIVKFIVSKIDINAILSNYGIECDYEYSIDSMDDFYILLDFIDAASKNLNLTKYLQITSDPFVFRTIKTCLLFGIYEKVNEIEGYCFNSKDDKYIQSECVTILNYYMDISYSDFVVTKPDSIKKEYIEITQILMYEFGSMQHVYLLCNFLLLIQPRREFINIPWINPLLSRINLLIQYYLNQAAHELNKPESYGKLEYSYSDNDGKITLEYSVEEDKVGNFLLSYRQNFYVSYDSIIFN